MLWKNTLSWFFKKVIAFFLPKQFCKHRNKPVSSILFGYMKCFHSTTLGWALPEQLTMAPLTLSDVLVKTLVMNSWLGPSSLLCFGGTQRGLEQQHLPWCSQQRGLAPAPAQGHSEDTSSDRPWARHGLTRLPGLHPARWGESTSLLAATTSPLFSLALASLTLQSLQESFPPKIYDLLIEIMGRTTRSESQVCLLSQSLPQGRGKHLEQSQTSCGGAPHPPGPRSPLDSGVSVSKPTLNFSPCSSHHSHGSTSHATVTGWWKTSILGSPQTLSEPHTLSSPYSSQGQLCHPAGPLGPHCWGWKTFCKIKSKAHIRRGNFLATDTRVSVLRHNQAQQRKGSQLLTHQAAEPNSLNSPTEIFALPCAETTNHFKLLSKWISCSNTFDNPSWAAQALLHTWSEIVQPWPVQTGLTQLLLPQPVPLLQLSSSLVKTKAKASFKYLNRKETQV